MTGYKVVNLELLVEELGEDSVKGILSGFSCPLNKDVETFLKTKAIEFSKQRLSQTHLVYASFRKEWALIGYYTLAYKHITVVPKNLKSSLRSRVKRFLQYNPQSKMYQMAAPLIAQLGKNYAHGYNKLISGDELLAMACDRVASVQRVMGGRVVYLECEDKTTLLDFYTRNGFCAFDRRPLDPDETDLSGEYLVQLIN